MMWKEKRRSIDIKDLVKAETIIFKLVQRQAFGEELNVINL